MFSSCLRLNLIFYWENMSKSTLQDWTWIFALIPLAKLQLLRDNHKVLDYLNEQPVCTQNELNFIVLTAYGDVPTIPWKCPWTVEWPWYSLKSDVPTLFLGYELAASSPAGKLYDINLEMQPLHPTNHLWSPLIKFNFFKIKCMD
jgi:hypothetical protein